MATRCSRRKTARTALQKMSASEAGGSIALGGRRRGDAGDGRPRAERAPPHSRPRSPVVYMSGHTGDELARRRLLDPTVPFLQKPFHPDELVSAGPGAASTSGRGRRHEARRSCSACSAAAAAAPGRRHDQPVPPRHRRAAPASSASAGPSTFSRPRTAAGSSRPTAAAATSCSRSRRPPALLRDGARVERAWASRRRDGTPAARSACRSPCGGSCPWRPAASRYCTLARLYSARQARNTSR